MQRKLKHDIAICKFVFSVMIIMSIDFIRDNYQECSDDILLSNQNQQNLNFRFYDLECDQSQMGLNRYFSYPKLKIKTWFFV